MKLTLMTFIILFCTALLSAPTRIALVAEDEKSEKTTLLLLAELSGSDFEFVERNQIKKIIQEHNLQKSNLCSGNIIKFRLFDSARLFAIVQRNSFSNGNIMIVFDTESGIRLGYSNLPSNPSRAIKAARKCLLKSLETLDNPQKSPSIILANINNAGAPLKFSKNINKFAYDFELSLSSLSTATVLERNFLKRITTERHLTKRYFPLLSSSYYLRLEFLPGEEYNVIDIILRLTDLNKKILWSAQSNNILDSPQNKINVLIHKLNKFIKKQNCVKKQNAEKEAKMLFNDFRRHGSSNLAKIQAVVALDNKNFFYQESLLLCIENKALREKNPDKILEFVFKYWNSYNRFKTTFPKHYKKNPQYPRHALYRLYSLRKHLSKKQLTSIRNIIPAIRLECKRLSNIKLKNDTFHNYWAPVAYSPQPFLYFNDKKFIQEKCTYWLEVIKTSRNFKRSRKQYHHAYLRIPDTILSSYAKIFHMQKMKNNDKIKFIIDEMKKFINSAQNHHLKEICAVAESFKFIIAMQKCSREKAPEIVKQYYLLFKRKYPKINIMYRLGHLFSPLLGKSYLNLYSKVAEEYQKKRLQKTF